MTERERDDELTKGTLLALNDMKIKFPGKSDNEAEYILDKVCHFRLVGSAQSVACKHMYASNLN